MFYLYTDYTFGMRIRSFETLWAARMVGKRIMRNDTEAISVTVVDAPTGEVLFTYM